MSHGLLINVREADILQALLVTLPKQRAKLQVVSGFRPFDYLVAFKEVVVLEIFRISFEPC
jgi:hypothetical protein